MIPPFLPSALEVNPQFAALYHHLTTDLLNPDGSTRAVSESQVLASERLRPHRIRSAKEELLRSQLRNVATGSKEREEKDVLGIPADIVGLTGTISMLLDEESSTSLSQDDYDLLQPEVDAFSRSIGTVAATVSKALQSQHDVLCKIASASQPQLLPSNRAAANSKRKLRHTENLSLPSLPSLLVPLLPTVPNRELQSVLAGLAATTTAHSILHRQLLSTTITHAEGIVHGVQTRYTKARAAHLSVVAMGLAKRIQVLCLTARRDIYRPDVQDALRRYAEHLQGLEQQLEERERVCTKEIELYENVGVDEEGNGQKGIMREVGRRYGELLKAIEGVKREVDRLERGEENGGTTRKTLEGRRTANG